MGFTQTAAKDGEILREEEYQAAIDHPMTSHDTITRMGMVAHAKVLAAMFDEGVVLSERARVEEEADPLTGGELALLVLGNDTVLSTTNKALGALRFNPTDGRFGHRLIGHEAPA